MQNCVGRSSGCGHAGHRVLEGSAGENLLRQALRLHKLHDEFSCGLALAQLPRMRRWNSAASHFGNAQELTDHRHRVCCELSAAGSRSRTGTIFYFFEFRIGELASAVRADCFKNILNRDIASMKLSRRNRTSIKHDGWQVQASDCHYCSRNGLIAADEDDEPVKMISAGN